MPTKPETTTSQKLEMIERVVETSNLAVIEQMPKLQRGLALGKAMKQLRELVDNDVMNDVMELAESPLGFRTDRDGKDKPYPVDVIKDAVIHCLLRGGNLVGNEFNVISGKCYLTKEYYERQVRELVNDLRVIEHVPQMANGGALVPMEASWVYEGRHDELKCLKTDEGDARIAVRVNAGMGVDAVLGKAYRKLYARIYRRVTGSHWLESEAETTDTVPAIERAEQEPVAPLQGLTDALMACETVNEVNALEKRYERQITGEDEYSHLGAECDARREQIRAERGERSNGQVAEV